MGSERKGFSRVWQIFTNIGSTDAACQRDSRTQPRQGWGQDRSGDPSGFKSLGQLKGRVVVSILDSRVLKPRPFQMWERPGTLVRPGFAAAAGCAGADRELGCRAQGSRPGGGAGRGGGSWPGQARAAVRGAGIQ